MQKENTASAVRLLVTLDGSQLAEAVLPLVKTLAAALGAHVTLLHVLEHHPPATIHGQHHLTTIEDAEAYLARTGESLLEVSPVVETHVHPNPERDVAASIAAHAEELKADLIVLAAHGEGGLRSLLVGHIPQQVASKSTRPVLIVPVPDDRPLTNIRRIMVPVDQAGEEEESALPIVQRLAMALRAEVILLTVVPTPTTLPGDAGAAAVFLPTTSARLLDWAVEDARVMLGRLAAALSQVGVTAKTEVRRGNPARVLVQAARKHDADLVIMATHGKAGLEGLWAGSVAPRVVASARRPLLLVPIREQATSES